MMPAINIKSVTNNVGWSVLSKTSTFGLKFVTVPILARLLSPQEFGAVAVAQTVVLFLAMIGSAGLAAALVVERDEDMTAAHSVFWANLGLATLMAVGLYLSADLLAGWLGAADAAYLLRVMALLVPIQLGGEVAYALLARRMAFDREALWNLISESVGSLLAVCLALFGWGVWALVAQLFASAIIRIGGLFYASGYRPRPVFSPRKVVGLTRFSLGVMGSELFNFITFQAPVVIVSQRLGLADAGAVSAANRFSSIPNQIVLTALMGVLFPVFSHLGDDTKRRSNALMLSTQVSTVLLAPMMFGLWAIAEPAMLIVFGAQWAYAWPVLGLLALSKGIVSPCGTFIPYLKGVGKSDVLWWVSVLRSILTCGGVAYGVATGGLVDAMVWLCVANAVTLLFYSWAVFRANGTPFISGFYVAVRPMLMAALMAVAVRLLLERFADGLPGPIWSAAAGIVAGIVIYGALILLTERPLLKKLMQILKRRRAPILDAEAGG